MKLFILFFLFVTNSFVDASKNLDFLKEEEYKWLQENFPGNYFQENNFLDDSPFLGSSLSTFEFSQSLSDFSMDSFSESFSQSFSGEINFSGESFSGSSFSGELSGEIISSSANIISSTGASTGMSTGASTGTSTGVDIGTSTATNNSTTICQNQGIFDEQTEKCNCSISFQGSECQITNQVITIIQTFSDLGVNGNSTATKLFEQGYSNDLAYMLSISTSQILFDYIGSQRFNAGRRLLATSEITEVQLGIVILDLTMSPSQLFDNLAQQLTYPTGWFRIHSSYGSKFLSISAGSASGSSTGSSLNNIDISSSTVNIAENNNSSSSTGVSVSTNSFASSNGNWKIIVIIVSVASVLLASIVLKVYFYLKKSRNRVKPLDEGSSLLDFGNKI